MPHLDRRVLILDAADNVCVACIDLPPGTTIGVDGTALMIGDGVALGHKIARRAIAAGEKVLKYGAPIGVATRAIAPGEHVHLHNLRSDYLPTYTLDGTNPYVRDRA